MSVEGRQGQGGRPSMSVPDKIIYRGQDRHYGLNASPRELHLDSQGHHDITIKMNTPPRTITLANSMTSLNRTESNSSLHQSTEEEDDVTLIVNDPSYDRSEIPARPKPLPMNENFHLTRPVRQSTEVRTHHNSSVQDYEEDIHELRQQLNRVTRRMLALEEEMADRKRERYYFILAAVAGYAAIQAMSWIRNGNHHF